MPKKSQFSLCHCCFALSSFLWFLHCLNSLFFFSCRPDSVFVFFTRTSQSGTPYLIHRCRAYRYRHILPFINLSLHSPPPSPCPVLFPSFRDFFILYRAYFDSIFPFFLFTFFVISFTTFTSAYITIFNFYFRFFLLCFIPSLVS